MELLTALRMLAIGSVGAALLAAAPGRASAQTPQSLWEKRIVHAPAVPLVLSGDTLWVIGTERRIHSLAARTGRRHWRKALDAAGVLPVLPCRDLIVIGLGIPGPSLLAMDRTTGKERWNVRLGSTPVGMIRSESRIVAATARGAVKAVSLADGAPLWEKDLGRTLSGVAFADSSLYVLGRADSLWCLATRDGARRWAVALAGIYRAPPALAGSRVLCSSYEGAISVHDPARMGESIACLSARAPQTAPPGVAAGSIASVAAGGEIDAYALPSLESLWTRETGETVAAGAQAWGEWWVIPTLTGKVLGITRARGVVAWSLEFRTPIALPPAAEESILGLIDERGRVVVYTLEGSS